MFRHRVGESRKKDAFSALLERFKPQLIQYVMRISHFTYDHAEDILQEVFVKVWNKFDTFDEKHSFSAWIYRITHNETISEFRKSCARKESMKLQLENPFIECLPSCIDISNEIHKKILAEKILQVLSLLQPRYSQVLVMKFLEDKPYNEISRQLAIPEGTLATLLHRAKRDFRKTLRCQIEGNTAKAALAR